MENGAYKGVVTRKDVTNMFWRSLLLQATWNYERLQNLGFLFAIKPVLKKVYKDSPKEEKVKAMKRHLQFFNTNPIVLGPILGMSAAMEEQGQNNFGSAIESIKTGLMGPLAGLGDSIFWMTWKPICLSMGAAFLQQGNPIGLVIAFLLFNVVAQPTRYYLLKLGYEKGTAFITEAKESGIIQRYTTMASILGLTVIGGLIPQMVTVKVPLVIQFAGVKVAIQTIFDSIIPAILPLIVTLACTYYVKKGKSAIAILLIIIIVSILGKWIGLL